MRGVKLWYQKLHGMGRTFMGLKGLSELQIINMLHQMDCKQFTNLHFIKHVDMYDLIHAGVSECVCTCVFVHV